MDFYGTTFTMLRDSSYSTTSHYDIRYWSQFWLLDENGTRVGDRPRLFSVDRVEEMLAALE